jgi:hypothetical protein
LSDVRIEPWGAGDFALLEALNAPEMTAHLRCNDWRLELF